MYSGNSNTPSHSIQNQNSGEPHLEQGAENLDILSNDRADRVNQRIHENKDSDQSSHDENEKQKFAGDEHFYID
jgi:hypothetical protein